jgi:membrane protein YdbS with pleckstrin-like domain
MAQKVRKTHKTQRKSIIPPFLAYWEKENYILFLAGIIICVVGFFYMSVQPWHSFSSLVISPILLFIGYAIVFPAAILYRKKKEDTSEVK